LKSVILQKSEKLAHGLPEPLAPLLVDLIKSGNFTHLVGAHTALGKNAFPRAAALLDVAPVGFPIFATTTQQQG
jgi:electron transfer flavoprotein alpha subunit